MKLFELEGCIAENGHEILMEKVEEHLSSGVFDVEMFN
jgi:hypothetical protein